MLSPYRVLDLTGERGAFAGYLLAAVGADVVAVEPPEGSSTRRAAPFAEGAPGADASLLHFAYDRGKRSVVLDLDGAADRARFDELVAGADVLLESACPEERERWGFAPGAFEARNPALVHASITPFGIDGPKAGWAATDLTITASATPLSVTGDTDRPPVRVSVPQAYAFAGAAAAGAVQLALYERASSRRGQHVDVSAQQVVALATQGAILADAIDAPYPVRAAGGATVGKMRLRFLYPAADGYVSITHVFGDAAGRQTADLMAWVHEAGFCDEAMRDKDWMRYPVLVESGEEPVEAWEATKAAVAAFTASRTKAELLAGAVERRLLMAPVADLGDVVESEQLAARGFWDEVDHPGTGRRVRGPGAFARFSRRPLRPLPPAPRLGEHTEAVLAEPARRPAVPDGAAGSDAAADTGTRGVLDGVKVLDLTWSVAAPAMLRVLADHGATVVKVESVVRLDAARTFMPLHHNEAGLENSGLFDDVNAGKRSLSLKFSQPEGRAVLDDLVRWADVVVDSLSPRALRSLGLDEAHVRELNPGVITMSASLFGQDGPLAQLAGYGNLGAALSGFYDLTGWPDREPAGPYLAYTDYTSSHLMLVAVLAALDHHRRTGEAQSVDLSQTEAALHYLSPALFDVTVNGHVTSRRGNDDSHLAPHGVYPCAGDDQWVAIACQDDAAWSTLCELMGRADLAADAGLAHAAGRLERRRELDEAVSAWTREKNPAEVQERCQRGGVAAHLVARSADALADPQLRHRGHFVELEHPLRYSLVENTRFRLSRTPGRPAAHAPTLGEHTFEVLTEMLGYDEDRIADLAAAEVLE